MNQNIEVLNAVYQNAQMAIDSIETLSKKVTDSNFRNDLHEQRKRYSEFANMAVEELEKYGARADDISTMSKLGLNASINMNMMMNNHTGHLAEMMIQGTNMGVIELKKCINHLDDVDAPVAKLCMDMHEFERRNIDSLKNYL